jgi:hypothetical protein
MIRLAVALLCALCLTILQVAPAQFPENPEQMTQPTSHAQMVEFLEVLAAEHDHITLSEIGRSVEGKALLMVRINPDGAPDPWRILLVGAQHGDEPAGKEAILSLIGDLARSPGLLPPGTELISVPMYNPDGADRDQRRNAAGRDLNRDHVLITEPETLALHRLAQAEKPHVIVDCHEYGRDPGRYTSHGWIRRADIMMGAMNNPHFNEELVAAANNWVAAAADAFQGTDITYREYYVGGPPPAFEQRFSTMTTDDIRNGLGSYGALSFIIESGLYSNVEDSTADLGARVRAYRLLLTYILQRTGDRERLRALIDQARTEELPPFLPVHYFWGNAGVRVTQELVRDARTGADIAVPTANFQHDRIVKRVVARPGAYAIPAEHAEVFRPLLEKHALDFEVLEEATDMIVEPARRNPDHPGSSFNNTTSGSWAVELLASELISLPAGSLLVPAKYGSSGRKAALILEPTLVEGLHEAEPFGGLEDSQGHLPVYRIP